MTGIGVVKFVTGVAVGSGTNYIVRGIVDKNVDTKTPVDKVLVSCGTFGISMLVTDLVKGHTNAKIDIAHAWIKNILSAAKG